MSIRKKNGRWRVDIWIDGKKTYIRPGDHGMEQPRNERQARKLERLALAARDSRRPGHRDETVASFRARWMRDFPNGPRGNPRGEATQVHYMERTKAFADEHKNRALSSITEDEAREWANQSPGSVPVIKRMFNDAIRARRCQRNPFDGLAVAKGKGREDITVLTVEEVDRLADIARDAHSGALGEDMAALIVWLAYTCMRPGEAYAARYSLLDGDVYDIRRQYNSRLRRETPPKHGSVGAIFVPEPAQQAVLGKPRRLDSDLMFLSKRGRQLRQQSFGRYWEPVRAGFMQTLPVGHHLLQRLALDPEDRLDAYELRHMGASFMLNVLGIEPWVIAQQLRHSDDGALVLKLYGHPTRQTAIERMRRAFTASKPADLGAVREERERGTLGA